ncbi:hypothetical protein O6H91_04G065300 [Diphasiastrum complanatum]|uniref:Uncharacterized protein n=1 Tax=Diphasiastrum complanatum TaxID=34168 RepID=A0ACC2DXH2_DIPCM|nr:hypothetical protein O6H91_04G065300 [Diphasiastrum complanatum]
MAMAGTSDEGWRCLENGARSTASMPSSLANKKHPKFRSLMHCYLQKSQSPPLTLASASASASAIPNSELGFGKPALDCENAQNEEGFEMLYSDWTIMPGGGRRRGRPRRCSWEGEVNHAREIGNEFANRVQVKAEKSGIGAQKLEIRGEEGGIVAKKRAKLQNDNCKGPGGQTKMKALKMLNEEQNDRRKTSALERLACVKKKQSNCRISNQKRNHLSSGMQIMLSDDFFDVQKTSSEEHSAGQNSSDRDNREVVVNARENSSYGNNFATYSSIRCISIGRNKTQKRSNSTMQTISSFKKDGTNCFNGTDLESKVSSDGAAQRTGRTSHVEAQEKFETKGSFSSLTRKHQQNRVEKASQRLFSTNYHNVVDEETFPDRSQTISTKDCSLQDILKSAENDRSLPFQKRKKRKRSQLQLQNSCQKKVLDRLSYADSQSDNVWLEQGARFASNAGYVKNFSKSTAIHVNLEMEDRERDKDSRLWLQDEIQVDCPMSRITAFYDSAHLRHHGNTTASFQESENTGAKSIKLVGNILKSSTTSKTLKVARSKSQSLKLQMQRVMRKCAGLVHGTGTMSKTKTVARNPFKESAQRIANFLPRKPLQVKWREVYIGLMDPTILVSIRCKVYWPKDDEWYTGFISEYNQHTKKHRIIYDDEEEEWLLLLKERLALHISLHEKIALALGSKEQVRKGTKRKQGFEELAVLAASIEDFQGDYHHGDIVWSEIKGYPMWPAFVMDEEHALAFGLEPVSYARLLPVQFFGSHDCARINPRQVVIFSKGLVLNYHSKCKRVAFRQGLEEVERYLKDRKLPGSMTFLQEEVSGSITQQTKVKKQAEQTEDEDFMGDERQYKIKKSIKTLFTCPIVLGSLCVLSLGKIVKDSEYFHDHKYIWTEGYTAIRKFSSMKDPSKVVNYRMEILRSPVMRSLPVFHVTPDDGDVVEGSSASACWKRIFEKVSKAKCSSAASASGQTEKKRPVYKSGPAMFGFANAQVSRLIQALPSARACSKFMAWSEKVPCDETEELLPAGFKPVEVQWKHLDRCSVCYTNEEYEGNALRQCDKCRMLVHINCYGDLETPDGDLSLCKLCQPVAPKHSPPCCLCPIKGGAMKETTDGRWVHLACALWIPETCFVDTKRMEPVDGLRSINKERWKLICSICKVPYGVCIQCAEHHCRVAYHPLCARAAGLHTEVFTGSRRKQNGSAGGTDESFTPLRLLSYCKRHRQPREERNILEGTSRQAISVHCNDDELHNSQNSAGCARCGDYFLNIFSMMAFTCMLHMKS